MKNKRKISISHNLSGKDHNSSLWVIFCFCNVKKKARLMWRLNCPRAMGNTIENYATAAVKCILYWQRWRYFREWKTSWTFFDVFPCHLQLCCYCIWIVVLFCSFGYFHFFFLLYFPARKTKVIKVHAIGFDDPHNITWFNL